MSNNAYKSTNTGRSELQFSKEYVSADDMEQWTSGHLFKEDDGQGQGFGWSKKVPGKLIWPAPLNGFKYKKMEVWAASIRIIS